MISATYRRCAFNAPHPAAAPDILCERVGYIERAAAEKGTHQHVRFLPDLRRILGRLHPRVDFDVGGEHVEHSDPVVEAICLHDLLRPAAQRALSPAVAGYRCAPRWRGAGRCAGSRAAG
jgi:hypothetical protein